MPRFIYMYMPERGKSEGLEERSGRPDLNWGPRGPKPRALTRLRHAPALDCRQIVGSPQPAVKRSSRGSHVFPLAIWRGYSYPHLPGIPICTLNRQRILSAFGADATILFKLAKRARGTDSPRRSLVEGAGTTVGRNERSAIRLEIRIG